MVLIKGPAVRSLENKTDAEDRIVQQRNNRQYSYFCRVDFKLLCLINSLKDTGCPEVAIVIVGHQV
jgi:hypothetical protein